MNATTARDKILSAVVMAERVVGKKESLPVLSCILLETAQNRLLVRSTNLEAGIQVVVPADVQEEGIIAIPASIFSQTLRSLMGDKVQLQLEAGNLRIKSRGSSTLIKAVPHTEFPVVTDTTDHKDRMRVSRTLFLQGLQSVSYAASSSMIRPELGSVYVSFAEGTLTTVATDSFRLAEKVIQKAAEDGEVEVLIPLKHVTELVHVLEKIDDEQVFLGARESQLVISTDMLEFVSRIVDASFPNYKEIIPKKYTTEATIVRGDLLDALRKARVFSGTEQRVGLHLYPKKKVFDITAQSAQIGEMSDSVDAALEGEDIDIHFHIGYVADCLPHVEADSVLMGFSGPGRPLVMRGTNDTSFTYLVMPLNR